MVERKVSAQDMYKAAQSPAGWLISAEQLRDAGEVILQHELQFEIPYFRAYDVAVKEAISVAYTEGNVSGSVEIPVKAPNYPPAQLLYAYAIENALKGLIIANDPNLIGGDKLDSTLKSHELLALAELASFQVHVQEMPVLKALATLSVWAGRYPVASKQREYINAPSSHEVLDYGSRNVIMRMFFKRAFEALTSKLAKPLENKFGAVVVFRQPGT